MIAFLLCLVIVLAAMLSSEIYTAAPPQWQGGTTLPVPVDKLARAINIVIVLAGSATVAGTLALAVKAVEKVLVW